MIARSGVIAMSKDKVEAVERALAVLNAFHADTPTMTLSEIASATGFYKSTILRLAGSLERLRLLLSRERGRFPPRPAPVAIGVDLPGRLQSRRGDQARAAQAGRGDRRDGVVLYPRGGVARVPVSAQFTAIRASPSR